MRFRPAKSCCTLLTLLTLLTLFTLLAAAGSAGSAAPVQFGLEANLGYNILETGDLVVASPKMSEPTSIGLSLGPSLTVFASERFALQGCVQVLYDFSGPRPRRSRRISMAASNAPPPPPAWGCSWPPGSR